MGLPCDETTNVYGDNQSVLAYTSFPSSQLKKKANLITYHFVCEEVARDIWHTTYVNMHDNTLYLVTKALTSVEKRWKFVHRLIFCLHAEK